MWEKEKPFEGAAMDTDNMEHMAWLYEQAAARAKAFNIQGVTQMLTLGTTRRIFDPRSTILTCAFALGVVKNIIPAITSINAIVAGSRLCPPSLVPETVFMFRAMAV